jgi:hypothetical protein
MIHCAIDRKAELVIVSRDSDYGMTFDGSSLVNDHLAQEFSERVSQKRKVTLHSKLSDALKLYNVPVSPKEEQEEEELAQTSAKDAPSQKSISLREAVEMVQKQLALARQLARPGEDQS